jgi:predicted O-linked N-acetylglucosamine transferase (SPINDLY family)
MDLYNSVDIGLDPFPYNGTTTTFEALWMGVPVISLLGDRHVSRVGASILTKVGLTKFIGENIDDYIQAAVDTSADDDSLEATRVGLRNTMRSSALCDAKSFALDIENAYSSMWSTYVEKTMRK